MHRLFNVYHVNFTSLMNTHKRCNYHTTKSKCMFCFFVFFFLIQVSYKNTTEEPLLMTLPGCASLCPLDNFINLTRDVVPEDWHKECLMGWKDVTSSDVIGNYCFPYVALSVHHFLCHLSCGTCCYSIANILSFALSSNQQVCFFQYFWRRLY